MRWLLAATVCVLAVDAAKQIVGNAYQYPLPGGGATTFIKGPAYASRIQALAANGPSAARNLLGGTVNSFTYAPHGTFGAQVNRVVATQPVAAHLAPAQVSHGLLQPHPLVNRVVHHYPAPAVVASSPLVLTGPRQQITVRSPQVVEAPRFLVRAPQVLASPQRITVAAPPQVVVAPSPRVTVSAPRIAVARAPQVFVSSPRVVSVPQTRISFGPAQATVARAPQITLSSPQVFSARVPQIAVSSPRVLTSAAPQVLVGAPQVLTASAPQIAFRPSQTIAARAPQITISGPRAIGFAPQAVSIRTPQLLTSRVPQISVSGPGAVAARVPQVIVGTPRVIAAPTPQVTVGSPQITALPRTQITVGTPQIIAARAPQVTFRAPQTLVAPQPLISAPRVISAPQTTFSAVPAPQITLRAPQVIAARAPLLTLQAPPVVAAPAPQVTFQAPTAIAAPAARLAAPTRVVSAPGPQITVGAPQLIVARTPLIANASPAISAPVRQIAVSGPGSFAAPAPRLTVSVPHRVSVSAPQIAAAPAPLAVSAPRVISVQNPRVTVSAQPALAAPVPQIFLSAPQVIANPVSRTVTIPGQRVISAPTPRISLSSPQVIIGRAPQISFFTAPRSLRPAVTSFIGSSYLANNYLPQRLSPASPGAQYTSAIGNAAPSITVVGASRNLPQGAPPNVIVSGDNNVLAPGITTIHQQLATPTAVTSGATVNLGPRTVVRQSIPITGISSSVFTKLVHVPATTTIISNRPAISSIASSAPTTTGLSAPSGGLVSSVGSSAPLLSTVVSSPTLVAQPRITYIQRHSSLGANPGASVATFSAPAVTAVHAVTEPVTTSVTNIPSIVSLSPPVSSVTTSASPNRIIASGRSVSNGAAPFRTSVVVQPGNNLVASAPGAAGTQVSGVRPIPAFVVNAPAFARPISVSQPIASPVPVNTVRNVIAAAAPAAVVTNSIATHQQVLTPTVQQVSHNPSFPTLVSSPIAGGAVIASPLHLIRVPTQVAGPISSSGFGPLGPALGTSVVAGSRSPAAVSIPGRASPVENVSQLPTVTQIAAPVPGVSTVTGPAVSSVNVGLAPTTFPFPVVQNVNAVGGVTSSFVTKHVQLPVSSSVLGPMYSQQFSVHTASPTISIAGQNNILRNVALTGSPISPSVSKNVQLAPQPLLTRFTANDALTKTLGQSVGSSVHVSRDSVAQLGPQTVLTTTSALPVLQSNSLPAARTVAVSQGSVNQAPVSVSTAQTEFTLDNVRLTLPRNLLTGYTVPIPQSPIRLAPTAPAIPSAPEVVVRATNAVSAEIAGLRPGSGYVTREVETPIAARLTSSAQSANTITNVRSNLHEIHLGGEQKTIRVEEFKSGPQVIRVHDSPPKPAEVFNVEAPVPTQDIVRIVSKSSGPPHIERVVHEGGTQVFDVQKPAAAPEQIVQIERGPPTPPRIEISEQQAPIIAAAPAIAPSPIVVARGTTLSGVTRVRASPLARITASPVAAISADSAPEKVVVRKLVPAGTFGTRLRRRKLSNAATSR